MARKKTVRALAARSDVRIYEGIGEALGRHLGEVGAAEPSLAEILSERRTRRRSGIPKEETPRLLEGETLSEAVIAEREGRDY